MSQDTIVPTPSAEEAGVNPPAEAAVPAVAAPVVTPAASEDETVTVKKSDWNAHIGRQAALDKKEARLNKREAALRRGQSHFTDGAEVEPTPKPAAPAAPADGSAEDRKAERGLLALALDPEYRAVLDADPTLRSILTKNPLSLLPIYAADAIDADDAVELIKEELDNRKTGAPAAPVTPVIPAPVVVPTPIVTGAPEGVATEGMEDPEYKDSVKTGSVQGVAKGIAHRLGKAFKH